MLPADLMEDFVFVDGKATFKPSMLWRCMEEGKPITMDEINLLPFDSLRFLQGILDGKTEFQYKGNTVHIKDGFAVIGTMNLSVNGMVYGLPEPLVDRCSYMEKFKLTAEQLMGAIM
jgi:MoxR-like ATPase